MPSSRFKVTITNWKPQYEDPGTIISSALIWEKRLNDAII